MVCTARWCVPLDGVYRSMVDYVTNEALLVQIARPGRRFPNPLNRLGCRLDIRYRWYRLGRSALF